MAKAKQNVIVESVSKGQQDVDYVLIETIDGQKLKFDVRSNSYKFQGHARVSVWNTQAQAWNLVHAIFPLQMQTIEKLCYVQGERSAADFAKDVAELRRVALAVLF